MLGVCVGLIACARTAEPDVLPSAVLAGIVTDADTGMPLPRVTVTAKLAVGDGSGSSITDDAGRFRVIQLDATLEYVVVARAEGFDGVTTTLTLVGGDNQLPLTLKRTRVCQPGSARCTQPPAAAAVLSCNALGTAYTATPCGAGEMCAFATTSCGRVSNLVVAVTEAGGSGRVTSTPAGILCPPDCDAAFAEGTAVQLSATPMGEARLAAWSGACTGAGDCMFTASGTQMVGARFEGTGPSVTVQKMGVGTGAISSSPVGIDCGGTCTSRFPTNTLVTLAVVPSNRSVFVSWTGCDPVNQPRCQLTAAQGALVSVQLDAFYERPLAPEAGCLLLLHFEVAGPYAQACGGGVPAVATGTASFVPSRHPTMRNAYEAGGTSEEGWIDTMKVGVTRGQRTIEMSVYRLGPAFEGRTRGTLYSDLALRGGPGVELVVHDDGRLVGTTRDDMGAETTVASMPAAIPVGAWRHVELLADAQQGLRLKIENRLVGETNGAPSWTASSSTAWVGAAREDDGGAIDRFYGRIDEVRFGNYGRN